MDVLRFHVTYSCTANVTSDENTQVWLGYDTGGITKRLCDEKRTTVSRVKVSDVMEKKQKREECAHSTYIYHVHAIFLSYLNFRAIVSGVCTATIPISRIYNRVPCITALGRNGNQFDVYLHVTENRLGRNFW